MDKTPIHTYFLRNILLALSHSGKYLKTDPIGVKIMNGHNTSLINLSSSKTLKSVTCMWFCSTLADKDQILFFRVPTAKAEGGKEHIYHTWFQPKGHFQQILPPDLMRSLPSLYHYYGILTVKHLTTLCFHLS